MHTYIYTSDAWGSMIFAIMHSKSDTVLYFAGKRFIKVAKCPMSPPLAFSFEITSSGISLLNDDGIEMTGPQINTINYQGLFSKPLFS